MKKLRKILLVLMLVVGALSLSIFGYGFYARPIYEGEILLKNIQKEATVYFDDFGVPHIYASSEKEAMTALGFVHAQDRLWQMELLRRIASGRLSEIFGSKLLKTDLFFAGLGINENSEKAIAQLDLNSKEYLLAQAYLDGVNQYLVEGITPIEFQLLGLEKQKFSMKDVYNVFGYMAFSFAMAQKTDPLLTDIRNKLGAEYLKDFGLDGSLGAVQIQNFDGKEIEYTSISKTIASLLDQSPIPAFIGSNAWVIGPEKTKKGKVIFANDPHIGFSQPCTWYEAHIVTPQYEMYGYYLAAVPFPLLGHNRDYAYGLTMFENDDVDFFQEELNPLNSKQYKTANGYRNFISRNKTIRVKDSAAVVLTVRESQHGPIVNELIDGINNSQPVALSWIYTQTENQSLKAVYSLSHATNLKGFRHAVSFIAAPGLNIMYGDAKGNVAWNTSGKLYKLDASVNPNFILNGVNGVDDKKEYLDFSKNPNAINPSWNYVYSANNQTQAVDGYLYPGYYLPQDRAKRISGLLAPKNNWKSSDLTMMITDNVSLIMPELAKSFMATIDNTVLSKNEKQAIAILSKWKGSNDSNDIAPTIYQKWMYCYLKNTFKDELGEANFKLLLNTHVVKQMVTAQCVNKNSVWWDDIATKGQKETRATIITKSFHEAILALEEQLGDEVVTWTWNRVHVLEHQHPLGKVAVLRRFFNVGPFGMSGSKEVINNLDFIYAESGQYDIKSGPSTRRVIDFSDVENSLSILPTGQSGNVFSKHYSDQAAMYVSGEFRKMKMNKEEIVKTSTKLVFIPN